MKKTNDAELVIENFSIFEIKYLQESLLEYQQKSIMTCPYIRNRFFWLMLINRENFRYTKAESPCMKGEILIPLKSKTLVIGWQRTKNE
jgi:hypothetical protein